MPEYDAVVIGAGNGGLTGALTLAKAGRKVLLLERHNVPGGCGTSFVRGRFEFEVALHQLSGMGSQERPGPLRAILNDLGVMDKLEFVEMENLYRVVWPDTFDITLRAQRDAITETLQDRFPKEKDNIPRFFDLVYGFSMEMIQGLFFKDPNISKEKYPLFFKYALIPTQKVLDEYFRDPFLKAVLSIYWSYAGVPPRWFSFGDFAIMLFAYIEFKPYHLKGGSQALSNALLDEFINNGGEARFNCGAQKIITSGGKVTGVKTEQGDTVQTRSVLSNASMLQTYLDLMDPEQVPKETLESFRSTSIGPSAFSIYLGFDCEPDEIGIQETTNFIAITTDMDEAFARWKTLEQQGVALLTCYAEGMMGLAEKVFPGIRGHVEEMEIATPMTHLRYLGHLGGAIYGRDHYAKDTQYFMANTSPVQGLYFAGAWASQGGFQPTLTSGRSSAKAILKSMAKK